MLPQTTKAVTDTQLIVENSATSIASFKYFIQQHQLLHSATSTTSFSNINYFIQPTQSNLLPNTTISFCYFKYFILLHQVLHSATSGTSFCYFKCFILPTKLPLSPNEIASITQRSRIHPPTKSNLPPSAAVSIDSIKRMNLCYDVHDSICLRQKANSLKEKLFFFNLIPHLPR